jgi:predicted RNase H-like HicB family nuclease
VDAELSAHALSQARLLIKQYTLVFEPDSELGYVGTAREMPGVMADGETPSDCARALQFALETAVAAVVESGRKPAVPLNRQRRTEQVNVRLTPNEKQLLQDESSRSGFKGIADFLRAKTIESLIHLTAR